MNSPAISAKWGSSYISKCWKRAVAEARGLEKEHEEEDWSPQVGLGMSVLLPDYYVPDLTVRMGLYRRIAWLKSDDEVEATAAELIDRFGPLPKEAENLLEVVKVKQLCRAAGVAKIDAGPKGAVVQFHNDTFVNPAGLVQWMTQHASTVKLRPDQKLVYSRRWDSAEERLEGVRYVTRHLAKIAARVMLFQFEHDHEVAHTVRHGAVHVVAEIGCINVVAK